MSYSISVGDGPVETFLERFDQAVEAADLGSDEQQAEAAREAIAAAREALELILAEETVVQVGQLAGGTVSGHANPQHQPRDGLSRDSQSITLYQAVPAPA